MERVIAHLDMDAFFAAVEERDHPRFWGKPIVVGSDPMGGYGRGVVSTANYKAREYGIHSAMPIREAWRLAETARIMGKSAVIFSGVRGKRYGEVSDAIMSLIRKRVIVVEQASVDEIFLDVSFAGSFEEAALMVQQLKKDIYYQELLSLSVGVASSKLVAKIASDFKKPDGFTVVLPLETEAFLEKLSIRVIPGIGPKTEQFFLGKGIRYVRDLKHFSVEEMSGMLGKWGRDLYLKIRGVDDSPVSEEREIKSVGEQETFLKDTRDSQFIFERLRVLCETVIRRLCSEGLKGFRTIVVTVRFHDFETITRSHTLFKAQSSLKVLHGEVLRMFLPFLDARENSRAKMIRLVGVRVEKLV